jgi:hypothetical protein
VVRAACARNNVDPDLVNSLIAAESGFNPNAVSRKGAQGLMQLMPRTAAWLGVPNALDPASNVEGGTRYLRELLLHYNNDLTKALAAYNAGPERVEQYHGLPPFPETVAYVARIIRDLNRKKLTPPRPLPVPAIQSSEHPRFKATSSQAPTTAPGQFLRTICFAVECPLLRTAVLHFFTPKLESTIPVHVRQTRAHFSIAGKHVAACLGFYTITTYSASATSPRKTLMYSGFNCLSPLSS